MPPSVRPLRVAIVNDYDLVVAGVAAMLAPHHERVAVVELDSNLPVVSDVDVILYDTFGQVQGDGVDLEAHTPDGKTSNWRLTLPLSLSWDHRVIDGAAAARFNVYFANVLADLRRVLF